MMAGHVLSSSTSKPVNTRQVVGLDILRFLAAVCVMWFHLAAWHWARNEITQIHFADLVPYSWFGWVGVEIFFVISGFVITYSSEGATPYQFFRSRFVRLVPGVWICASFSLLLIMAIGVNDTSSLVLRYLKSLFFFPGGDWIEGVYWTLGIELAFYAGIFFLLVRGAFGRIELFATILGLVSVAYCLVDYFVQPELPKALHRLTQLLLLSHGCEFALGTTFWLMFRRGVTSRRVFFAFVFMMGALLEILVTSQLKLQDLNYSASALVPCSVFIISLVLFVCSLVFNSDIQKFVGSRIVYFRRVGLATYPLYLIHPTLGKFLIWFSIRLGLPQYFSLAVAMAASIACAMIVSLLLEPPLQKSVRAFLDRIYGRMSVPQS